MCQTHFIIGKFELLRCTVNEGQLMYSQKLNCADSLFTKHNYTVLSPNFHIQVSVSNLYIPRIGLPILLQPNRQTDPGNI
jgi:hypothetical protein